MRIVHPFHIVTAVLLFVGFVAPSEAQVVLTQAKLNAGLGGCDAPGYPLTICKPGSYKLGGNLGFVANRPNADIVHITSGLVTLDLNGFFIGGVCGAGIGVGIRSTSDTVGITIMNGSITCMGGTGILLLGRQNRVERIVATLNYVGIDAGDFSSVRDSTAYQNSADGISCGDACVITGNTSSDNDTGIFAGRGSTVIGNSIRGNSESGLRALDSAFSQNHFSSNGRDIEGVGIGTGISMGHNVCSGAPC